MSREELFEAIKSTIDSMPDSEKASLWNEYCDSTSDFDARIERMDNLPELFNISDGDDLFNLLNCFYFGHDENDENSSANPNREYFHFDGYGNVVTTDYPDDFIDMEDLVNWIIDNDDALYNDDIQELLDNQDNDDEDEE